MYDLLYKNIYGYTGAYIHKINEEHDLYNIKLIISNSDMKRFQDLSSSKSFLINKKDKSVIKLNNIPEPAEDGNLIICVNDPNFGLYSVRVRKGIANEKDIFIEVWENEKGFVSSLKVTDKLKML